MIAASALDTGGQYEQDVTEGRCEVIGVSDEDFRRDT